MSQKSIQINCNPFQTLVLLTPSGVDVLASFCVVCFFKRTSQSNVQVFLVCVHFLSLSRHHCILCDVISSWILFTSFPILSLYVSPHLQPPPLPPSLHSMRAKAPKLCLPLPPLLRPSTPHCPSPPAPRWTTLRWRRSWRSASSCRWRCRGYGKKTNRSGWDVPKQQGFYIGVSPPPGFVQLWTRYWKWYWETTLCFKMTPPVLFGLFVWSLLPSQEDDGLRKRKMTSGAAAHSSSMASASMTEEGLCTRVLALCVLFFVIGVIIGKLVM